MHLKDDIPSSKELLGWRLWCYYAQQPRTCFWCWLPGHVAAMCRAQPTGDVNLFHEVDFLPLEGLEESAHVASVAVSTASDVPVRVLSACPGSADPLVPVSGNVGVVEVVSPSLPAKVPLPSTVGVSSADCGDSLPHAVHVPVEVHASQFPVVCCLRPQRSRRLRCCRADQCEALRYISVFRVWRLWGRRRLFQGCGSCFEHSAGVGFR